MEITLVQGLLLALVAFICALDVMCHDVVYAEYA